MPRTLDLAPDWSSRLRARDEVASASALRALGFTPRAVQRRVGLGLWQRLLPSVYCCHSGTPTRRQLVIAALLWAGSDACIDGIDACHFHGVTVPGFDPGVVHVVVGAESPARSRDFVVVRRTERPIRTVRTTHARYLTAADAAVAAACAMPTVEAAVALLSEALRCGAVDVAGLAEAHTLTAPHGRSRAAAALEAVVGGARSAPEATMRRLMLGSRRLPEALFNPTLRLPGGRIVVPDALLVDSGIVHEVNGRTWHAGEDRFDSMQSRHDAMTVAGLIVLHNSPRRVKAEGRLVLAEIEQLHARWAGRGLPDGVVLLPRRPAPAGIAS